MSGVVGTELPIFAQKSPSRLLAQDCFNADDVIAFSLYLMNKKRWILIEIKSRSCYF